jgi:TetR/AcrR family transcriptional regulator
MKPAKIPTGEKVLKAALKEFALHGFDGARVDRIAKIAKVNKAMIYYHFKGKEALYEKVLTDAVTGIYTRISSILEEKQDPRDRIYHLVSNYIDYIYSIDLDFIRVMLREISTGGRYFRRVVFPSLIGPLLPQVLAVFNDAIKEGKIRRVDPRYTFFQLLGSIIFFNAMRIAMEGTELQPVLFHEGYLEEFKENLMGVLKYGIEPKERLS